MSKQCNVDKKLALKAYHEMLLIRRFEERAGQLYSMGLIGGFCHLYIGQEAVSVGMQSALKEGDAIITSYRDHGLMLGTGADPKTIMAELTGRATGCSKGKGGSMHMFDIPKGFYGGHGIVGAQVSLGTGIGFSFKYKKIDNLCVTYFGDGASNQGQVYESFNMAKLWNLPVIYVIENNEYGMGTSVARSCSITELYKRGESFGIPGMQVNGMDFASVYKASCDAVKHVRSGKGPILLEMKTYRYKGHSMSDPATYRSKEELDSYKENQDPIDNLLHYIKKNKLAKDTEIKDIQDDVKSVVAESVKFAKESPEPDESELYTDIYINKE